MADPADAPGEVEQRPSGQQDPGARQGDPRFRAGHEHRHPEQAQQEDRGQDGRTGSLKGFWPARTNTVEATTTSMSESLNMT